MRMSATTGFWSLWLLLFTAESQFTALTGNYKINQQLIEGVKRWIWTGINDCVQKWRELFLNKDWKFFSRVRKRKPKVCKKKPVSLVIAKDSALLIGLTPWGGWFEDLCTRNEGIVYFASSNLLSQLQVCFMYVSVQNHVKRAEEKI